MSIDHDIQSEDTLDRNDHRRIGRDLDLFASDPLAGPGLPLWLPDGAVIRSELERLVVEESERGGCRRVYTPVLAKRELFERSGHWVKFADDMYPPFQVGGEEYVLRPANCPHHALVYAARQRSFRDLPIRLSELGVHVPQRAVGRALGAVAGAPDQPGRLPCLLPAGPDRRRGGPRDRGRPPLLRAAGPRGGRVPAVAAR